MRRKKRRTTFYEPSLVPLADMLTNTVGIIVFILIFTVLVAGGVVVAKRLPIEYSTEAVPTHFLCSGGRILPMDVDTATDDFLSKVGRPTSFHGMYSWLDKFKAHRYEDEYFVVTGTGEIMDFGFSRQADVTWEFSPKEGKGETVQELANDMSRFRQLLKARNTQKDFVHFLVRPDSLDVYLAARSLATEQMGFGTGWVPLNEKEPVRFGTGGRKATEQ
jgi:hypothetical protein